MKFNVKKQECPKNIQIVFKYSKKKKDYSVNCQSKIKMNVFIWCS